MNFSGGDTAQLSTLLMTCLRWIGLSVLLLGVVSSLPMTALAHGGAVCVPGAQVECACMGGTKGIQVCEGGTHLGACQCGNGPSAASASSAPSPAAAPPKPAPLTISAELQAAAFGTCPAGRCAALQKRCKKGDSESCMELGQTFRIGKEAPKDWPRAIALFEVACAQASPTGCGEAGTWLMEGVESVLNKDPQKGAVLLERGCELKNFDSCLMLGTEYQFGSRGIRFAQVSPTGGVGVGW